MLLLVGVGLGFTPMADGLTIDVTSEQGRSVVEHATEVAVLIALMGVGLAIDRPLSFRRLSSWHGWSATWRLLAVAMPLSVGLVALLGWGLLGLAPATALLLGAVLSPTDPVLASDVQVGGPGSGIVDEDEAPPYPDDPTTRTPAGEVRFALTSEAGLNDGLAFPFVHAAVLVLAGGGLVSGSVEWLAWYVVAKIAIGVGVGVLLGRLLGEVAFRARSASLRLAEQGEPLLVLAAMLLAYGAAELAYGYGFLSVFACAMALRASEHRHAYHRAMHGVVERLERLLTLVVLLLLGVAFSSGLLDALDWRGVTVATALVFVLRPGAAWVALSLGSRRAQPPGALEGSARGAVAFFGIRGVGSVYYLAWALGEGDFSDAPWLWSTVSFTIALSVLVHGITSTPYLRRLEARSA